MTTLVKAKYAAVKKRLHITPEQQQQQLVRRIQTDPVWYAENILNLRALKGECTLEQDPNRSWELDDWQKDLLNAMADPIRKRRKLPTLINHEGKLWFTVSAMHGPGKTFTAALIAHWFNTSFQGRIVVTAPKFKQLTTRFMPEFRKIANRAEAWYRAIVAIDTTKAEWCANEDWCLQLETARNPESLAGHHYRWILIIVEEATGVPESLWPVIISALSTGEYVMLLMISNPTRRTGTFAQSHLSPQEAQDYFRMQLTLDKCRRVSRVWAAKLRRKYGENSPIYKIRALGQFATDDVNQLLPTEHVTAAFFREREDDGSLAKLRVTVDVGDGGVDETTVTVCKHFNSFIRLRKQKGYNFPAETAQYDSADAAERLFLAHGGRKEQDDFVVDATGVGTGCAGVLLKRGYRVIRYKGGEASSNPLKWRNRRVQSYMVLRDIFRDGQIVIDDDAIDEEDTEEFMAQLCSVKTVPDPDGKVEDLITRMKMKADGEKSPDKADSLAMQMATQAPAVLPGSQVHETTAEVVAVESNVLEGFV